MSRTRMKKCMIVLILLLLLLLLAAVLPATAQVFSYSDYHGGIFRSRPAPAQVPGASRLEEFVVDGKLRLGLEDAITLALLNNSEISVDRATYDISHFAVLRAHQPFDPL